MPCNIVNFIQYQLCRTDWGANALEELRALTKDYKEKQKEKREEMK